jgi:hypothetical protein
VSGEHHRDIHTSEVTSSSRENDAEKLGMVVHTCNPSAWEEEAGESRVPGQPGLRSETFSKTLP